MEITLLLTHGKIHTMDGRLFEAMAVSKDRIVKLGSTSELRVMGGPGTLKLDLKGKTVLPGFNDSHLHLQAHGANRNSADLRNAGSIKELVETARRFTNETSVPGGVFDRDRNGNINGVFREAAIGWVFDRVPGKSVEQIKADLDAGIRAAVSYGITSIQTSDLHDGIRFDEMVEAYSELRDEGKLTARINAQLYLPDRMAMLDFFKKRFRPFEGDNLFRLGPVKLLLDGEAVALYTKGGAYATFEENEKGTLSKGKLADMAILSEDPFEVEPEDIKDIEVLTTVLGGEIVYTSLDL